MNKCHKCQVEIIGTRKYCPLCENLIENKEKSENIFPKIPTIYESNKKLITRLLYLSFITVVIASAVNRYTTDILWSWFVFLGIASIWIIIISAIKTRKNKIRSIFSLTTIASILLVLWDYSTGWHKWSIEFVLPTLFVVQILASGFLAFIIRLRAMDWLLYLFLEACVGFTSLIFIYKGSIEITIPSIICLIVSIISLGGLIIFASRALLNELKKRLHV